MAIGSVRIHVLAVPENKLFKSIGYVFVHAYKGLPNSDDLLLIHLDNGGPEGHVWIDKRLMEPDEFIATLKPIVEKHNMTLEVDL